MEPASGDGAANPTDARRGLGTEHNLSAAVSHVEHRQLNNDYTVQLNGKFYQIRREGICPGLRGVIVRIEQRLDGSLAVRFRDRYLAVTPCGRVRSTPEPTPQPISKPAAKPQPSPAMPEAMNRLLQHPGLLVWIAADLRRSKVTTTG